METKHSLLETTEETVIAWSYRYRMQLLALFLLILAAGIGFALVQLRRTVIENEVELKMVQAKTIQDQLQIARAYLGTKPIALSLLSIASQQIENGDDAGAKKTYDLFIENYRHHLFFNAAQLGRATAFELLGDNENALAEYLKVGYFQPADCYNPKGLLKAAALYEKKGDFKQAAKLLNDCSGRFHGTTYGQEAAGKLKLLSASP
jgi:tetratricopeptide (TPR) repeat protein